MKMSGYKPSLLSAVLIIAVLLVLPLTPAFAQVDFTPSEGEFVLANPQVLEQNFQSGNVAPGELESCDSPVNLDSDGDCFNPGDIFPGIQFDSIPPGDMNLAGSFWSANQNPMNALTPDGSTQSMEITFPDNAINAAGLTLGCLDDNGGCIGDLVGVDVFGAGGELLGSTQAFVSSQFNTFVGITSVEIIERIVISDANPQTVSFRGLSRVLYPLQDEVDIPTLSEWGLIATVLGLGIIGLFAIRRRAAART